MAWLMPGRFFCLSQPDWVGGLAMDTVQISLELPRGVLSALRQDPPGFVSEMRLAAAVKWYEMRRISQAEAAEVAGLSRAKFLTALVRFGVSPFQYDADEIVEETSGG
jgi:predicted HTH domain antitoxin